jgi:hypothetical protein
VADDKPDPYKKAVSSSFGEMSASAAVGSANRPGDAGAESFPILVYTDQGPIVLRLSDDCSGDYNAWTVSGDIPKPPFPTENLFCDPQYMLQEIENGDFTIRGTQITLCVRSGTMSGDDIDRAEAMMKWHEIGLL